MAKPALLGGRPIFGKRKPWPMWPYATKRDEARVAKVVRSGRWGIGCEVTDAFAKQFADYTGARRALPVSTGTAALELIVKALGMGPGDEVIVPAYTFIATATCVLQMGATVVFADVDPETFCIDSADAAQRITSRTRAIIPVHFGGNPCDMVALGALAKKHDLAIIEDACHAHGCFIRGRHAGTLGRAGAFSFQSTKNMASGEGGMLVTDDDRLHDLASSFHSFGRVPGGEWYEHYTVSWNQRMAGLQAALLIGQLERLESQTATRLRNARVLNQRLSKLPGLTTQRDGDTHPKTRRAYHIYMLRLDADAAGLGRGALVRALQAEGLPAFGGYPVPIQRNTFSE